MAPSVVVIEAPQCRFPGFAGERAGVEIEDEAGEAQGQPCVARKRLRAETSFPNVPHGAPCYLEA
jgi:hypothetical protein